MDNSVDKGYDITVGHYNYWIVISAHSRLESAFSQMFDIKHQNILS